jgi:hypothetical protein
MGHLIPTAPSLTSPAKPKSSLARSFTKSLKRGLSVRAPTIFESDKASQKPLRPTISLPLERPDLDNAARQQASGIQESSDRGWVALASTPTSPTSSASSARQSIFSSPASSRTSSSSASSSSRTSYGEDSYFPPLNIQKKVTIMEPPTIIRRRDSCSSLSSSIYGAEGELPPPIEEDEETMQKLGKFRFAAAEYIQEIEGTPLILVDGKLYL